MSIETKTYTLESPCGPILVTAETHYRIRVNNVQNDHVTVLGKTFNILSFYLNKIVVEGHEKFHWEIADKISDTRPFKMDTERGHYSSITLRNRSIRNRGATDRFIKVLYTKLIPFLDNWCHENPDVFRQAGINNIQKQIDEQKERVRYYEENLASHKERLRQLIENQINTMGDFAT